MNAIAVPAAGSRLSNLAEPYPNGSNQRLPTVAAERLPGAIADRVAPALPSASAVRLVHAPDALPDVDGDYLLE